MQHPITTALGEVSAALTSVDDVNPVFMPMPAKAQALLELSRLETRMAELRLRLMAAADDVADDTGARSIADWLARRNHHRGSDMRADLRLAHALDTHHPILSAALRAGEVNVAQARVITRAIDDLPSDTPRELVEQAEAELVRLAEKFDPTELSRLGRRILEVIAPDLVEDLEGKRLADLEKRARERQRLALRACGDGLTRISGLLPDPVAARLITYLHAFDNPRRPGSAGAGPEAGEGAGARGETGAGAAASKRVPYPRRAAQAFAAFLEAVDPDRLPVHGGDATTVVVTIDFNQLLAKIGTATLAATAPGDSVDRITASHARRLACNAHIIPAVLGGDSQLLDLGRSRRLFSSAQRRALLLRHPTCQTEGCDIPGTWCEAHHWLPWSHGGATDLANATLLCSVHHHRAHDPAYRTDRHTNGDIRFHRRC